MTGPFVGDTEPMQAFERGAEELGMHLTPEQIRAFQVFTEQLLEWNQRVNLTRIVDPLEIVTKHYLDSLSLLSVLDVKEGAAVIDVGTGAGLPGIALKIARPDLKMTLLDSLRKRLAFIEHVVGELGLTGVETVHSRAEDAARDSAHRGRYDLAVSRAVATMNVLAELCLPFCAIGGRFASYKGPEVDEEVKQAARAVQALGGHVHAVHAVVLPGGLRHTLVVVEKTRPTSAAYPRKAGTPEREPL